MFYSLAFILLYIVFNVYMALQNLLLIVPAALYLGKALCDVLMGVNGYHMYKDLIGPEGSVFQL